MDAENTINTRLVKPMQKVEQVERVECILKPCLIGVENANPSKIKTVSGGNYWKRYTKSFIVFTTIRSGDSSTQDFVQDMKKLDYYTL